jgi:hypothetical protein
MIRLPISSWPGRARWAAVSLLATMSCAVSAGVSLAGRIELPGTHGRLDHLAIDLEPDQLFVAALGDNAIEVIDLKAGKRIARLEGHGEPQGLVFMHSLQRLLVANGGGGYVEAFEAERREGAAAGLPDADNLRLDAHGARLYVGFGTGLAAVDPATLEVVSRIALPGHPEAFELSARGAQIYVNVPTVGAIVVVDRTTGKEMARWAVSPASRNFAMALGEASHRLFVATRGPPGLQVFDTARGVQVAQTRLCGDADDLFLDSERHRLYAVCGDGQVDAIGREGADRYTTTERIATSPGARTGLWVPATQKLFVAAPATRGRPAVVLVYRVD